MTLTTSTASPTLASDAPSAPSTEICQLIRLPGELRNLIHRLLITPESSTHLATYEGRAYIRRNHLPPPLAYTCKQMKHEILSIYFGVKPSDHGVASYELASCRPDIWREVRAHQLRYLRCFEGLLDIYEDGDKECCGIEEFRVGVTDDDKIVTSIVEDDEFGPAEECLCILARHAKDVEAEVGGSGSIKEVGLMRFLTTLEEALASNSKDADSTCRGCGKEIMEVRYVPFTVGPPYLRPFPDPRMVAAVAGMLAC